MQPQSSNEERSLTCNFCHFYSISVIHINFLDWLRQICGHVSQNSLPSQSLKLHHLHLIMKINCNNKCLSTNYLWGHLVLDFCLLGVFVLFYLTTDLISLLVIDLFIFSIFSWLFLGKLYISRHLFFFSMLSVLLAYNCSNLLWSFVFLWYWLTSLLSALILFTWALSLFLDESS